MSEISTWHPSETEAVLVVPDEPEPVPRPLARRRRMIRWVATVVTAATLVASLWWVTNSRIFDLRTVRITGNSHESAARIERVAGLSSGTNLLWLSTGTIARRLERDPWVLRVTVSRTLPSTLTISIHERYPVAVVQATAPLLVAGDGVLLGRVRGAVHLPVLSGVAVGASSARIPAGLPGLAVARTLSQSLRRSIVSISETSPGFLTLLTRGGVTVLYGDAEQAEVKALAVQGVLSWAYRQGLRPASVDVRAPSAPALLPVGAVRAQRPPPPTIRPASRVALRSQ